MIWHDFTNLEEGSSEQGSLEESSSEQGSKLVFIDSESAVGFRLQEAGAPLLQTQNHFERLSCGQILCKLTKLHFCGIVPLQLNIWERKKSRTVCKPTAMKNSIRSTVLVLIIAPTWRGFQVQDFAFTVFHCTRY